MFKKLYLIFVALIAVLVAVAAFGYYWYVIVHPGSMISEEHITGILGRESHVYYSDGKTVLGVFFDRSHRQYIQYGDIPENFVRALIAAEDSRFFTHFGLDPKGIVRAALKNIRAMRVVEGGSTLTQQTAKNLYQRADRSLRSKLAELLFALRLERYYPKEKILEFYANQFFVTGNGHGLVIAARYYFDKNPNELSLIECAYIAGSVKRPNYYNPLIKKTEEDRRRALANCRQRTTYVLEQMRKLQMISEGEYRVALDAPIPFRQGKIGYAHDAVTELAREAVDAPEVSAALERHGVTNIATAGLKVVTTIDKDLQRRVLFDLRHQLSLLDVTLNGYENENADGRRETEASGASYRGDADLAVGGYFQGLVTAVSGKGSRLAIGVDLGEKRGSGIIDHIGLRDMQAAVNRHREATSQGGPLIERLRPGVSVWVSAREIKADGQALFNLEQFPQVMGAAIVLRHGQALAVAGGVENRFFNRATAAQRAMGSSFKPFLYAAALQLGWNSADLLDNRRGVFVYRGQPYFPRPDHFSPHERVSLSYAGVHSENVATIWLLAHLCDQLTAEQFRQVADYLDLTRRAGEGYSAYATRIRDRMGIQVGDAALTEAAYRLALGKSSDDFVFENLVEDYLKLRQLPYGASFARFAAGLEGNTRWAGSRDADEARELATRAAVLSRNFVRIEKSYRQLAAYRQRLTRLIDFASMDGEAPASVADDAPPSALYYDDFTERAFFLPIGAAPASSRRLADDEAARMLADMPESARQSFWRGVSLTGGVSAAAVEIIVRQMEAEKSRLAESRPYHFDVLANIADFRILVGMEYLRAFGRRLGIASALDGVLSLPLGSNVVTLFETTRMYEALITGRTSLYGDGGPTSDPALSVLDRIESADGEILYRPNRHDSVAMDEKSRLQLGHVLESVVLLGTGKRARREVRLFPGRALSGNEKGMAVPLLGKTGTANNYTNASFFGYLPALSEAGDAFLTEDGQAIGVYVGYDDNRPMRAGGLRVSGAVGALPTWIDIAGDLLRELNYEKRLDPVDVSFNGLMLRRERLGQQLYAADPEQGGALEEPPRILSETDRALPSILTFAEEDAQGVQRLERHFAPFWRNPD
jgi:membrane peptidoglycan carboxypeptidase